MIMDDGGFIHYYRQWLNERYFHRQSVKSYYFFFLKQTEKCSADHQFDDNFFFIEILPAGK